MIENFRENISFFLLPLLYLDFRFVERYVLHQLQHCNTLQHMYDTRRRLPCNNLQHPATPCSTLQHPAAPCNTSNTLQHPATPSNTQQHPATPSNTQQHPATPGSTLQHPALQQTIGATYVATSEPPFFYLL